MVSYARPTMIELLSRVGGDIASRTEGHAFIHRMVEVALGFACAGLAYGLHGHLDWVRRQQVPQTADVERLSEWGDWLGEPRKAGARAQGEVTTSGVGTLAAGALFTDGAGNLYRVRSTLSPGRYDVQAVELGAAQNLPAGESLTLVTPAPGVEPQATITVSMTGGASLEDREAYRPRVIAALRTPAFTGAPGEYQRWALRQEGITRAWEFDRRLGPGTVVLTFAVDGRASPIPTSDDVAAIQALLNAVQPADALGCTVIAPIESRIDLAVTARGTMSQAAVAAAVRSTLATDASVETPLPMSVLREAISSVPGEISHDITAITVVERGVPRVVSPDVSEIPSTPLGMFTLGTLDLTVAP